MTLSMLPIFPRLATPDSGKFRGRSGVGEPSTSWGRHRRQPMAWLGGGWLASHQWPAAWEPHRRWRHRSTSAKLAELGCFVLSCPPDH